VHIFGLSGAIGTKVRDAVSLKNLIRLCTTFSAKSVQQFRRRYTQTDRQTNTRKGKGKGQDTCYSATYTSRTRDQQRYTISEVAADWHEPMVPQRIMWPSIARANGQLDAQCS